MPKLEITTQQRSALRAAAHSLRPVVLIGDRGLSESVLKEIDTHLTAHELIKIRMAGAERETRDAALETVCEALSCAPVHHLGKILVIWRPRPPEPAESRDPMATRAVRRPSEPYTPKKKMAASGDTQRTPATTRGRQTEAPAPAHRIARRAGTGSALSLRAGARRHLASRAPRRK